VGNMSCEGAKPHRRSPFVDPIRIAQARRFVSAIAGLQHCAVNLQLPIGEHDPIGQVRGIARRSLAISGGPPQPCKTVSLEWHVAICMLREKPSGMRAFFADQGLPGQPNTARTLRNQ
jgi:hypothetical protein